MDDPVTNSAPLDEAPADRKRLGRALVRLAILGVVGVLTVAALRLGIPWVCYRCKHVVLGNATIKGTVTKIGARIEGQIKRIEVDRGQHVVPGQVLLRLEDQHLQAALARAQAQVHAATNELQSEKMAIEQDRRRLTLEIERANGVRQSAAGELEAEKGNLERLRKEHARVTALIQAGIAAASDMDRITGDRDRSQGLVKAATGTLDAAGFSCQKATSELEALRVREARLGMLEAQVAVARANVAAAEAELEATMIRAPQEGWVLERIVEVGGSAKVGEPMISLWIGRAWVEAWASETDLNRINIGNRVDVSLDAFPSRNLAGRVEAIGLMTDKELQPTLVPSTLHALVTKGAMVPVRIALEESNSPIQLGLSAVVGIQKETGSSGAGVGTLLSRLLSWVPSHPPLHSETQ